jgi:hypothetical protein
MSVFEQLSSNKGTISSALGKALAQEVLQDDRQEVLSECIALSTYKMSEPKSKQIRAGAAKVVQVVAETRPELVAPHLEDLLPGLSAPEPQTRWMIIRTMGSCAHLNEPAAHKAVPHAKRYLEDKEGLVLASSADLFLGDLGALSKENAKLTFPLLKRSMETVMKNEQDWLLEALFKVYEPLDPTAREAVLNFAEGWKSSDRKSTQKRARRILALHDMEASSA